MKKVFDIELMEPCIFRDSTCDNWIPAFFSRRINHEFPFVTMENTPFAEIAPLEGNEKCIGNKEDAFNTWDKERVEMNWPILEEEDQ